jgi:hypothetical protein
VFPAGQQQPCRTARQRQQDALGKQLARDAGPRRPQRAPDGELLLPRRAARQQQVCDVDAGNQQNERDSRQQRQQGGAQTLHPEVAQRRHGGAHVRVVRVLPGDVASYRLHLRPRLRHAHARLQAAIARKLLSPRPKSVLV